MVAVALRQMSHVNPALDLLYRFATIGFSIYLARKAWYGYVERKILFVSDDWLDWSRLSDRFASTKMSISFWAVSYTHLDVYKRQPSRFASTNEAKRRQP